QKGMIQDTIQGAVVACGIEHTSRRNFAACPFCRGWVAQLIGEENLMFARHPVQTERTILCSDGKMKKDNLKRNLAHTRTSPTLFLNGGGKFRFSVSRDKCASASMRVRIGLVWY